MTRKRQWIYFLVTVLVMTVLDQFTKWLAVINLKGNNSFSVIPGVFRFSYLQNYGAAFSSMQGKSVFLIAGTIIVLAYILYQYNRIPLKPRYLALRIIFAMLTAGAIGNMIDRVMNGYVVDFLDFYLINFPVFNVADCYVTISVILFAVFGFFFYKEEEIDFLFLIKKQKDK